MAKHWRVSFPELSLMQENARVWSRRPDGGSTRHCIGRNRVRHPAWRFTSRIRIAAAAGAALAAALVGLVSSPAVAAPGAAAPGAAAHAAAASPAQAASVPRDAIATGPFGQNQK